MKNLPSNYELQFSKEQVATVVKDIGKTLTPWVGDRSSSSDPIALCILRGGVYFFCDLIREIDQSLKIEFLRFSTYSKDTNEPLTDDQIPDPELSVSVKGRSVILVDEICDSGRVLRILKNKLLKLGATEVLTVTLVYRNIPNSTFKPDHYGFEISHNEWLVGLGLDDKDRFSNLPDIYKIKHS